MADRPTAVLIDDAFHGHDTGTHPEHPRRIRAIRQALDDADTLADRPEVPFTVASDQAILRVHTERHLRRLQATVAGGGAWIDADTMVAPDSLAVARLAAGAAVAAVDAIVDGRITRACCLGRPPGHHATPDRAMGFCLLNTVAIAAAHARARGLDRVAIVDWDVHHGNGTQDIFFADPDVWYASIHQHPLYPGTGDPRETGIGAGAGTTRNAPMPPMSSSAAWVDAMETIVSPFVERAEPDLILLSAGYDAHRDDPVGNCRVDDDGFAALTTAVTALADRLCGGKVVAVLEGGYDPPALARCVLRSLDVLDS